MVTRLEATISLAFSNAMIKLIIFSLDLKILKDGEEKYTLIRKSKYPLASGSDIGVYLDKNR